MAYFHDSNGYSGFGACGSNCSCSSCSTKHAGLSEYYFEDKDEPRKDDKSAGLRGIGESATTGRISRDFKIVAKSYIAPIGRAVGNTNCEIPFLAPRLRALALATDAAYSENPLTDSKDKRYRLYSSRTFTVTCGDSGIISVVPSALDSDAGTECIPGTSACLQPPPLELSDVTRGRAPLHRSGRAPLITYEFSWTAKGRPHALAEPAFQLVCPRISLYIWHTVSGRIECDGDDIRVNARVTGSQFPSHRVFVNGVIHGLTVPQGPFSNLWIPRSVSNPTLVR
jgi:hypothetical protein